MARAGNALIGALRVSLSADTAQFEAGLKSAQSSLAGFGKRLQGPLLAVGAAVAGAVAGITAGLKSAIDTADEMGKAAQKFGVPVEALSALSHAAELADVSLETLGTGLRKLSQSMVKDADGFKQLGINIRDAAGNLRSTEDVFTDLAEAFSRMPDGAQKTALAVELLGRSGAELIPLLNSGSAGLKAMTEEARKLGLVITKETAAGAEQFNDNLTRLGAFMRGVFLQVVAKLAPLLADLSNSLFDLAKNSDLSSIAVTAITFVFKEVAKFAVVVTSAIKELLIWSKALADAWETLFADNVMEGDFAAIVDTFKRANEQVRLLAQSTSDTLRKIENFGSGATTSTTTTSPFKVWKDQAEGVGKAVEKIQDQLPETGTEIAKTITPEMERMRDLWNDIGSAIENQVVSAINDLVRGTFKWKDALASALTVAAQLIASIGSNAIAGQGGWGAILGFAGGGSFKVGGSGGVDSQLVQFRATPGEVVNVSKDGGAMGGFTFAPSTVIDARGSTMTEAKLSSILDARDKAWAAQLPGQFRAARIRGKV